MKIKKKSSAKVARERYMKYFEKSVWAQPVYSSGDHVIVDVPVDIHLEGRVARQRYIQETPVVKDQAY